MLLPSVDGKHAIDAYDAGSAMERDAMGGAVPWYGVALALVFLYFANLFRVHRGKVQAT